jgi:phosphopentomutase
MRPRAFVVILDGLGLGDLPDSREFGDEGRNTLANLASAVGGLSLPTLESLGLARAQTFLGMDPERPVRGAFGRMAEKSQGKDSTTGHWELAGLLLETAFPVFPDGFPAEFLDELSRRSGHGFIGNQAASGTEIIERLGDEHLASGKLIVYTSADSVFQVAAHEAVMPLAELYDFCRMARELLRGELGVSRVIARPFFGESGAYERSPHRRDFSLAPPGPTLLDRLLDSDLPVTGIGKVMDLFADRGFSRRLPSKSNEEGMARLDEILAEAAEPGLVMVNLVDFDMLWGHRRDTAGYAAGLKTFDRWLGGFLARLGETDRLFITADHGNDPTGPGSDHTREYVPILALRPGMSDAIDLGLRQGFGDLAETLAEAFGLTPFGVGRSFWRELEGVEIPHDQEA